MNLVELTIDDLAQVVELESSFPVRQRWSETSWRDELAGAGRVSLGVVDGEHLVGAITLRVVDDMADLYRIVVAPSHRRRGIADDLLREGLRRVTRRVLLEVRDDNTAALALYRKHGFAVIDRRHDYYGANVDALILEREWEDDDE